MRRGALILAEVSLGLVLCVPRGASAEEQTISPEDAGSLYASLSERVDSMRRGLASGRVPPSEAASMEAIVDGLARRLSEVYADLVVSTEEAEDLRRRFAAASGIPSEASPTPPPAAAAPPRATAPPQPARIHPAVPTLSRPEAERLRARLWVKVEHFRRAVSDALAHGRISEDTAVTCQAWIDHFIESIAVVYADGWVTGWEATQLEQRSEELRHQLRGAPARSRAGMVIGIALGSLAALLLLGAL